MKKSIGALAAFCIAASLIFTGCQDSGKTTLKMGDNHPDRNSGVGAVLERVNAEFLEIHEDVKIVTESYQDQPWQEKVKIYATANKLPDIMKYWTFPGRMVPLVEAGLLEKLNKDDFAEFGYMPGALESSEYNGELYGIPVSADLWVIYVNKSLFARAGVPLPNTWEDVIASVPAFRAINVTPMVTNGMEGWPLCIFFDGIAQRINGDFTRLHAAIDRKDGVTYTDPDFVQAAQYIQNMVNAGVFSANLTISDYGDARNQFGQERAAMYMMGAWEMGLATDANFSESFHNSLDVIKFPLIAGGKGVATDTQAWFGGNYIISARSKNKELAHAYLRLLGEKFGEYGWETQAFFPAQKVEPRPDDTLVAKKLLQIAAEATSTSGTPGLDRSSSVFNGEHQELMRQLCSNIITPEEFCRRLDAVAEQASKEL
ncbi:MAG: extracellular solute-binding protein [Treponema sp.]|nr:extracellular solute-binding protein [Treponema sp.]